MSLATKWKRCRSSLAFLSISSKQLDFQVGVKSGQKLLDSVDPYAYCQPGAQRSLFCCPWGQFTSSLAGTVVIGTLEHGILKKEMNMSSCIKMFHKSLGGLTGDNIGILVQC